MSLSIFNFLFSDSSVGLIVCFCVFFIRANVCVCVWSILVVPSRLHTAPVMVNLNWESKGFNVVDTPTGALQPPPVK